MNKLELSENRVGSKNLIDNWFIISFDFGW